MTQIKAHIPKIRFKEFSWEWEEKKLWEVSNIIMGQSPDSNSYNTIWKWKFLIQWNADINWRITNPRNYTSEITKECNIWDIILTVRAPVWYVAKSNNNACIGRWVCAINNKNNSDINFIYQFLLNYEPKWWKYSQWSTFTAVNSWDIRGLDISIPSLPEQQKIASFLSSVDEKIEKIKEKKKNLEEYKKWVMQKIFSQEIRFKSENWEEFGEWEEKKLGELSKITTWKLDANAMVENWKYRFYTCAKDYFKIDDYAFDTEALLVSWNWANVWYIHYYKWKFNAYQRTYVLDNFKDNIIYIKYFLEKNLSKRIWEEKNEWNTPYIVIWTLSNLIINLPTLKEQEKIADFLSGIDEKIEKVSDELGKMEEFKKGLLQGMFV